MSPNDRALAAWLLARADDELILGHRDSEWAGHAPILEEDIAFANIALDEIGHAQLWYGLHQELTGDDPDRLIFFREAKDYRCTQFVELPKGDWAFSMVRQYLFDAAEMIQLGTWVGSRENRIAEIAAKIRPEEIYHLRHTSNWVKRLGLGTEESHRRMQSALNALWCYALQLFIPLPGEQVLIEQARVPDPAHVRNEWVAQVCTWLTDSGLTVPPVAEPPVTSREQHTEHLSELLRDMQQVARLEDFGVEW